MASQQIRSSPTTQATRMSFPLFPIMSMCTLVVILLSQLLLCQGFTTTSTSPRRLMLSSHGVASNCFLHSSLSSSPLSSSSSLSSSLSSPELEIQIKTKQIKLSTGINAEIKVCKPPDDKTPLSSLAMVFSSKPKPPLVFIHGSFHASWCWAEHFFPYFANLGYPCYAISLRGTGGTFAGEDVKRVKIMDHVDDITSFLSYVSSKEEGGQDPILLGHSFGGLAIMKYLEKYLYLDNNVDYSMSTTSTNNNNLNDSNSPKGGGNVPDFLSEESEDTHMNTSSSSTSQSQVGLPIPLSGVCLMCSVPPSGNGKMTMRFLKRSFRNSWKITSGLAMRKCITDDELCRTLFFGGPVIKEQTTGITVQDWGVSEQDLKRYQSYFARDTVATISLRDLAKKLPSVNVDRKSGNALFWKGDDIPEALVIGAEDDFIVDDVGVIETAKYFGVEPVMVDSPHDVMLGSKWENTADEISFWLDNIIHKK